jgi:Fe-S oxidoreductase
MSPTAMLTLIFAAFAMFAWSTSRRFHLLLVGKPVHDALDHVGTRLRGTWRFAFRQEKMDYYNPAGIAHKLIFAGFLLLPFREVTLWGRGFYAPFNLWALGQAQPLGQAYEFVKDLLGAAVMGGTIVFFYYRLAVKPRRMTLNFEGVAVIALIFTLFATDMMYDGASLALSSQGGRLCSLPIQVTPAGQCAAISTIVAPLTPAAGGEPWQGEWSLWPAPMGSLLAVVMHALSPPAQVSMARWSFWTHEVVLFLFLNLLPYSKVHVLTAIPNVFLRSLRPAGRLSPMAESADALKEKVKAARASPDPLDHSLGIARIEQFTWKGLLDFYTCTECGRCSDNCPAHRTGKILSPKHLTMALRDHLFSREEEFIGRTMTVGRSPEVSTNGTPEAAPIDLVSEVLHPDVLWACTSCRACEEQCPVLISYVDKIIDMRRSLIMVRGEFPDELSKAFEGMETNGNPWNLARLDRPLWSAGLNVHRMKERADAPVLFWVGCAASYDERAKSIARATAALLKVAKVDFAILAQEENCTGDPARRAGNEVLFAKLAEGNVATIGGYQDKGGARTIVTTCPHCFNTLRNEYPDFGLRAEVVHHSDYLLGLVAEGKLVPRKPVPGRVVYHDSCYLGRYNGVYDPPREILRRIPGVELVEAEYWTKQRGLCCGAGGAQMWIPEQNEDRIDARRTLQLVDALGAGARGAHGGARTIASACPFCMTRLAEGIKSKDLEDTVQQLDVAELLERACGATEILAGSLPPKPLETSAPGAPDEENGTNGSEDEEDAGAEILFKPPSSS